MISALTYTVLLASLNIQHYLGFLQYFGSNHHCPGGSFLGLPPWYKYLGSQGSGSQCVPKVAALNDVWLIVLAIIEILLRIAAIAAVIYVLYGGVKFITSRGNPEKTASARTAIQDALIGLIIAVAAIAVVNFVGSRFN